MKILKNEKRNNASSINNYNNNTHLTNSNNNKWSI